MMRASRPCALTACAFLTTARLLVSATIVIALGRAVIVLISSSTTERSSGNDHVCSDIISITVIASRHRGATDHHTHDLAVTNAGPSSRIYRLPAI